MLTPLFLKVHTTQHKAIERDPEFYQVCLEHLGFLIEQHGFEVHCRAEGGPDAFAQIEFTDGALIIRVLVWHLFGLPKFAVLGSGGSRDLSDFARTYGFGTGNRDFDEAYRRLHPLDEAGRRAVATEYHEAVADLVARFGMCVHENLERFRKTA